MRLIFIPPFFLKKDNHKFSARMVGLLFCLLSFIGCVQQPEFDSEASRSYSSHTRGGYCSGVDMSDFEDCVEGKFFDLADDYAGEEKLSRSEKAELLEELLVGRTYQTCADDTGLSRQLEELDDSGEGRCSPSDVMQSFLRFSDRLILRVTGRVVRKIR